MYLNNSFAGRLTVSVAVLLLTALNRTILSAVCHASFVFLLLGIALTQSALAQDTVLHSFSGGAGDVPNGGLVASGGSVFGTTGQGLGTLFAIDNSGSNF